MTTLARSVFLAAVLMLAHTDLFAAQACPVPVYAARTTGTIQDWHDTFVKPSRLLAGTDVIAASDTNHIEALIAALGIYHRNSSHNPLFFEALMRQLSDSYGKLQGFGGLDTQAAKRIYQRGSGADLDFSMMCIDARTTSTPDDTIAVTLFGMTRDNCQHVGLLGLVFTGALVNGSMNGECRPDHVYYMRLIIPLPAGTNSVTFLCRKGVGGCQR